MKGQQYMDENMRTENNIEVAAEIEPSAAANKSKSSAKSVQDTDVIKVESFVPNVYYTCPRTMDSFVWSDIGDVQEMTFSQLKIMKNQHPIYFTHKWLYPKNEVAVKKLGLTDTFAIRFESKDMSLLYGDNVSEARKKITYVPSDEREQFAEKVTKAVKSGKIANVKMIRMLEKEFDIELMDLV